jgi:hypothetical protein
MFFSVIPSKFVIEKKSIVLDDSAVINFECQAVPLSKTFCLVQCKKKD